MNFHQEELGSEEEAIASDGAWMEVSKQSSLYPFRKNGMDCLLLTDRVGRSIRRKSLHCLSANYWGPNHHGSSQKHTLFLVSNGGQLRDRSQQTTNQKILLVGRFVRPIAFMPWEVSPGLQSTTQPIENELLLLYETWCCSFLRNEEAHSIALSRFVGKLLRGKVLCRCPRNALSSWPCSWFCDDTANRKSSHFGRSFLREGLPQQ